MVKTINEQHETKLPWTNVLHVNHKGMLPYNIVFCFPSNKSTNNAKKNTQTSRIL